MARGSTWDAFGMPPVLLFGRELDSVKRHDNGLAAIALADDFYAVGGMFSGGQISDQATANAPPTGFFAVPLNAAAGPGELLAIVQAAAGANDTVGQVSARAFKDMPGRKRMSRGTFDGGCCGRG